MGDFYGSDLELELIISAHLLWLEHITWSHVTAKEPGKRSLGNGF